jgi:ABC-type sugar transport systems, permease components
LNSTIYKRKRPLIIFLVPAFLFMGFFLYYPFIINIRNSFMDIPALGASANGMNETWYMNYQAMLSDTSMQTAMGNTFLAVVCTVVFQVGIALVLALLVDNIRRGTQFFRTVYFFPIVISASALGLLFNIIFLYDKGMMNQLLELLGSDTLVNWKDKAYAIVTMLGPVMWQYVGFYFVIIATGLNNIDADIYEAAAIDGAAGFQRVFRITLPLLKPVIGTCVVLATTGALKIFDLPWVMFPNGMPLESTWLTGTYMYYQTFLAKNVDYGSAIAVVIVALGIAMSVIVNRIFKDKDEKVARPKKRDKVKAK